MALRSDTAPLAGLKVLEVSRTPAAGFCGRQFRLWGASVTMVESRGGGPLRNLDARLTPTGFLFSPVFRYLSADKASIEASGPGEIQALVEHYDVLISDVHPRDEVAVFGATLETLRLSYPEVVIVSISPFGRSGPRAVEDAGALRLQALTGYLSLNGKLGQAPLPAPGHLIDHVVGANAFVGALAALVRLRRTGMGDLVEISGLETVASLLPFLKEQFSEAPTVREGGTPEGVRLLPCADGWVSVLLTVPAYAEIYSEAFGIDASEIPSDLFEGDRLDVIARGEQFFGRYTSRMTKKEVFDALQGRGVVCGPVQSLRDVLADPQLAALSFFERLDDPELGDLPFAGRPARLRRNLSVPHPKRRRIDAAQPLTGFKVLELTQAWMGPLAGQMLADLGADVVKIENPLRPDVWRMMGQAPQRADGPPTDALDRSVYFQGVNRNKRSLGLDLTLAKDVETFRDLVREADVVLENFTPKIMSRFGLGYDDLQHLRPGLVMASFSGFGAAGPLADQKANGASIEALAGWDILHRDEAGQPVLMGAYPADPTCALQMAACTLVALYAREVDGGGAHVEGSMLESAAAYIGDELLAAAVGAGTSMPAEQVIASAGRDAWFVTNAMDGSGDAEPVRSLAEALKDAQLVARSWFIELDDPGLGRRLFNGRFWRVQTAHLAEPRPAPRLAAI